MALVNTDLARIFLALTLLLVAAHGLGCLFARFRQPRVIGEIVGGLLLGPTVLGAIAPGLQADLFPDHGPTPPVLGAMYQLGLLLLLFHAGAEMRSGLSPEDRKTASFITVTGVVLPFLAGLALVRLIDVDHLLGPAGNSTAFVLVFAIAIAVTSIPVISRIMFDLGILNTAFARIVLTAAVIEDMVLYVVLAVALSLVEAMTADTFGLAALLGIEAVQWSVLYHLLATLAFLAVSLLLGPRCFGWLAVHRPRMLNPIAFHLIFMLTLAGLCLFLGVAPIFGALLAGIVASMTPDPERQARESAKQFSFAFFIPIYFAIVGLRLDLVRHFDASFFLWFLAFACAVKALSVYAGARLAGESPPTSWNLAVAMNARGGPGIVLATVSYDAGIVGEGFFVVLVMLSVLTSLMAGAWLERTTVAIDRPSAATGPGQRPERHGGKEESVQPRRSRQSHTEFSPDR